MINKAITFATLHHGNQFRKGTKIPYILHPLEAGTIAASLSSRNNKINEEVVAGAILHDIYEDTSVTYEVVKELFGSKVADLVKVQSEDKSRTWDERKQATIDFLKNNDNIEFEIVILADKLSNMRAIHRDFSILKNDLWNRFNVKDKNKHKWYYSSIGENIKQLRNTREYLEYLKLIDEVFG